MLTHITDMSDLEDTLITQEQKVRTTLLKL